jgi:hypothetical protein
MWKSECIQLLTDRLSILGRHYALKQLMPYLSLFYCGIDSVQVYGDMSVVYLFSLGNIPSYF